VTDLKKPPRDELRSLYSKEVGVEPPIKWSAEDIWSKLRAFRLASAQAPAPTVDRYLKRKTILELCVKLGEISHSFPDQGKIALSVRSVERLGAVFTVTQLPTKPLEIRVGDRFLGLSGLRQCVKLCQSGSGRWTIDAFFRLLPRKPGKKRREQDKRRYRFYYASGKAIVTSRRTAYRYLKQFKGSRIEPIG